MWIVPPDNASVWWSDSGTSFNYPTSKTTGRRRQNAAAGGSRAPLIEVDTGGTLRRLLISSRRTTTEDPRGLRVWGQRTNMAQAGNPGVTKMAMEQIEPTKAWDEPGGGDEEYAEDMEVGAVYEGDDERGVWCAHTFVFS